MSNNDNQIMTLQCMICSKIPTNHNEKMYCSHCIKTSPDLLLKLKLDLIILNRQTMQYKLKVENILQESIKEANTVGLESNVKDNHNNNTQNNFQLKNEDNDSVLLLSEKLKTLTLLKSKKRLNKINHRIQELKRIIIHKRYIIHELLKQIKSKPDIPKYHHKKNAIINQQKTKLELIEKINLIEKKILIKQQLEKLMELNNWFSIKKTDAVDISYMIQFKKIISLRKFDKFKNSEILNSIISISNYLNLYSKIINFNLPFPNDNDFKLLKQSNMTQITSDHLIGWLGWLIMNVISIAMKRKLFKVNSLSSIDLSWLLDHYDIDGLFYYLSQNKNIESTKNNTPRYNLDCSYSMVIAIISEALQIPVSSRNDNNIIKGKIKIKAKKKDRAASKIKSKTKCSANTKDKIKDKLGSKRELRFKENSTFNSRLQEEQDHSPLSFASTESSTTNMNANSITLATTSNNMAKYYKNNGSINSDPDRWFVVG
ncbi:hypothetical protein TBLA_0C02230 [Henningerozyma blattae CBS 6284]|uniref:Autophagy-related protein 14 n=1 Tax=Henningerozyma blattae (strain ATCC 34711 / CBS 6284 / DSM 70876 / NBRC 10599 / NRRL Y-10934 / UCD 77-7) TaxID=1071380 RepID=I2H0Y3_HENB6|nr:hypothetical protein TBLA_0C02230 [Tetrapisispora blattae CBS 6284]CCH60035.1 hypothetical protein TBLA_0C02230 [Tetrapisispora blattae CBS 6284]